MTIGTPSHGQGGRGESEPGRVVTTLPDGGSVLVRSEAPPVVPGTTPVDVRPGAAAVCDGDRIRADVWVHHGGTVRRFDTSAPSAIADAVAEAIATHSAGVVRFGDTETWRRSLPAASVDVLRRRVAAAAAGAGATFLAWTAAAPRAVDPLHYDVVLG